MAFNPQLINPIDLNPNLAVGVNLPFSGPSVFTPNYLTSHAIKNNLINYFLTNPGEIPLNPTFGGGLSDDGYWNILDGYYGQIATIDYATGVVTDITSGYISTNLINYSYIGLTTIATAVGEQAGTIEEVYEPFLIQEGFIMRTPRGREVTEKAYKHLGKVPHKGGTQHGLF